METRWLEDFLVLAETGSFTRSAELRHLTQPAFSRRIKALEQWLGADLIDRTTWPTRLTPAGELLLDKARQLVGELSSTRTLLRGLHAADGTTLTLAVPHTLSFGFVPRWLADERTALGEVSWRLLAHNVHDAVVALVEGNADLLLCYHHPRHPVELSAGRYPGLRLGSETLGPFARALADGQPQWQLPGSSATPLPFLGYGPNAYFRRMTDLILERAPAVCALRQCFETDMAEGLKAMVLEGHGVAFLPHSAVQRELAAGQLCAAGSEQWTLPMEIRVYRDARRELPALDALWQQLAARYPVV
ncbi:LysR substrate-binding domain-containing protein [Vogesella indigofera]|uniref:LysR substrate-binding domain-containing protein n=1 Tax=Vogesella indigofera TaxID=45465 RepID=UPI00234F5DF5|nr:LysR substrate-binding domain-containing protein [Vogesella indigofera]MDC7698696.1 LysR substrate-binding domain-containing protein [Vogesella indigofera]